MAPLIDAASHLYNLIATSEQLEISQSAEDGVPHDLVRSIMYAGARLTQSAGILLRLSQDVVAQAIITFTRFWIGESGGSLCRYSAEDVSAASLYLTAKTSDSPKSLRSVINVYSYLDSFSHSFTSSNEYAEGSNADEYFVSEGTFEARRHHLNRMEMVILQTLGFNTRLALPHTLCVNYLQTLGCFQGESGSALAKRAFAHLNSALLNPQLLYLTHQPCNLATAAIYLAAKEVGVKLPGDEWWEVFDTDREELGFVVVAFLSMEGFVRDEEQKWKGRKIPLNPVTLKDELEHSNGLRMS